MPIPSVSWLFACMGQVPTFYCLCLWIWIFVWKLVYTLRFLKLGATTGLEGATHPWEELWCPTSSFSAWGSWCKPVAALLTLSSSSYSLTSFTSFICSTFTTKTTMNYKRWRAELGNKKILDYTTVVATLTLHGLNLKTEYPADKQINLYVFLCLCVSSPRTSRCSWAAVQREERWRRSRKGCWAQTGCWTHTWHTALWEETSRGGTRTWKKHMDQKDFCEWIRDRLNNDGADYHRTQMVQEQRGRNRKWVRLSVCVFVY